METGEPGEKPSELREAAQFPLLSSETNWYCSVTLPSQGRALNRSSPSLEVFCIQVFFEKGPSSATSLLSSVYTKPYTHTRHIKPTFDVWLREMWRPALHFSNHARQDVTQQIWALWSSPDWSSATRSSVFKVLLLLPVFFQETQSKEKTRKKNQEFTVNTYYSTLVHNSQWILLSASFKT